MPHNSDFLQILGTDSNGYIAGVNFRVPNIFFNVVNIASFFRFAIFGVRKF